MSKEIYQLPDLGYDYTALEPAYSSELLELHHAKHHQTYVDGANKAREQLSEARAKEDFDKINQLEKNLAFNLSGCLAEEYLKRPEPLAWALAALMAPGSWSRIEHKLACLRRIAAARLKRDRELLLVNFVEEYLPLTPEEAEEYKILSARNPGRKGEAMWMPWSERMKEEGRREGIRLGPAQPGAHHHPSTGTA